MASDDDGVKGSLLARIMDFISYDDEEKINKLKFGQSIISQIERTHDESSGMIIKIKIRWESTWVEDYNCNCPVSIYNYWKNKNVRVASEYESAYRLNYEDSTSVTDEDRNVWEWEPFTLYNSVKKILDHCRYPRSREEPMFNQSKDGIAYLVEWDDQLVLPREYLAFKDMCSQEFEQFCNEQLNVWADNEIYELHNISQTNYRNRFFL